MRRLFFILLFLSGACKQSYLPPVSSTSNSYLVVDGFVNNSMDSTYISLTHTFKLDDTASVTPELHAQVTVEGRDSSSYPLSEWGNGQYGATSLALNSALQYRLHIRTASGKEYVSDYLDLKTSPPIDSISWARTADGVQIYANTHDPQNASHYYRWDYLETWEFNSNYAATLQFNNNEIEILSPDPYYTCWKYAAPTTILIGSSTALATDVIALAPLVLIPSGSWKIGIRYSIQVKQYVLTADAFNFWAEMQKSSQNIGTIFSTQPSQPMSNVHNVADTTEEVIGFVSAGTMQKTRIFITPDQIPDWIPEPDFTCTQMEVPEDSVAYYVKYQNQLLINGANPHPGDPRQFYNMANKFCVDCRNTGTIIKPSFWP